MLRRFLVVIAAVIALAGCQLDAVVTMTMEADGSGEVMLTATVDADVVAEAGGLAGALQLADAEAAGWIVDGPTATDDGGQSVTLSHPFATAEEAAVLLRSVGPPFGQDITITRAATNEEVTVAVAGTLALPGGSFDAFADAALAEAAGGVPFAEQLSASGATPAESMSVELALRLPGEVIATTGTERDGAVVWDVDLSGATTDLATETVLRADGGGGGWAGPVSTIALVLLGVWMVAGTLLIVRVVQVRRRRRGRRTSYIADRYR